VALGCEPLSEPPTVVSDTRSKATLAVRVSRSFPFMLADTLHNDRLNIAHAKDKHWGGRGPSARAS